jgi:long-chain fatty acid transport protein
MPSTSTHPERRAVHPYRRSPATVACAGVLAAAAVMAASASAEASGFATARFGSEHGHPTTDNPTAIYYNPAGIADREPGKDAPFNVRIFVDANLALRGASYSRDGGEGDVPEPAGAEGANNGSADLFNVLASPMIGAVFKIEDFAIGAAFYIPFGGQSNWAKNDKFENDPNFAGPYDGVQRWASIDGTLRSFYISFAAAYDIGKYVSVGAGFNVILSQIETVRAREVSGTNDVALEGRSLIDVRGTNASFGAGVLAEPIPGKLWLGASYQAQPGLGTMVLEGTLKNNFSGSISEEEVKLFQELPAVYRLGARWRPADDVELRLFGDVTDWSVFDKQCLIASDATECEVDETGAAVGEGTTALVNLKRDWNTAFAIRGGGSYWPDKEVEVFAGMGYDSNAVPDETLEPALTDFDDISFAAGAKFRPVDMFAFSISYTHFIYFSRDTTGKNVLASQELPTKVPDFGGEYSQAIGVINTNVELSF